MTHPHHDDLDGAPIPVLRELLGHAEAEVRADAACALGDRLRTREVAKLDNSLQEELAALLNDPVPMVQLEAAIALAEAHDRRATTVLLRATRFRALRLDATRALGTLGDPEAKDTLRRMMERWLYPWADRLQAAAALCALADSSGAAYLKAKLHSRRSAERAAAVHFIGESHHPEARTILEGILADLTHPMRDVAARALGFLGDPASSPALEAAKAGADAELLDDIDAALALLHKTAAHDS